MSYLLRGREVADFRSDTVTRPTDAMRRAMAEAEVGDDVLEGDPTVERLEAEAAAAFGKEAGLFTPTGTMGNLIALKTWCRPGDEVLVEALSHTYNNEAGGAADLAHVMTRTLPSARGLLDPDLVARVIRPESLHSPRTALLCLENTHNFHGGAVVPLERSRALAAVARARGVAVHLDGARLWNAVAATGVPARAWGETADTIQFCLSKGLGAPVGSVVVGPKDWIGRARRVRKALGGGMRQAGVLAAAGLLALREGPGRLHEDHARARRLAEGLAALPGVACDPAACETNIVFARAAAPGPDGGVAAHEAFARALEDRGVLAFAIGDLGVRFLTHREVDDADVDRALAAAAEAAAGLFGAAGVTAGSRA